MSPRATETLSTGMPSRSEAVLRHDRIEGHCRICMAGRVSTNARPSEETRARVVAAAIWVRIGGSGASPTDHANRRRASTPAVGLRAFQPNASAA